MRGSGWWSSPGELSRGRHLLKQQGTEAWLGSAVLLTLRQGPSQAPSSGEVSSAGGDTAWSCLCRLARKYCHQDTGSGLGHCLQQRPLHMSSPCGLGVKWVNVREHIQQVLNKCCLLLLVFGCRSLEQRGQGCLLTIRSDGCLLWTGPQGPHLPSPSGPGGLGAPLCRDQCVQEPARAGEAAPFGALAGPGVLSAWEGWGRVRLGTLKGLRGEDGIGEVWLWEGG